MLGNFHGPNGPIWYTTITTGTSDPILLIFTVAGSAPQVQHAEAQVVINALQCR